MTTELIISRLYFSLADGAWIVVSRDPTTMVEKPTPITVENARFLADLGVQDTTRENIARIIPIHMALYT